MFTKLKKQYNSIPETVKATLWYVFCSMLQRAISFLSTPIFTRLMSTTQYGQVTIYSSWVEVFMVFATLDIFYGVYNNALTKYPDDRETVTSSMQGLCTFLTLCLLLVYFLFRDMINQATGMSTNLTLLMFCELLFVPAFRFWSAKERYEYKYKKLIALSLIMAVLSPLIGIPLVIISEEKGYARIISIILSETVIAGIIYFSNFRRGKKFYHKQYWHYAFMFNLPLIPHYLSSTILSQSDRVMIDRMCGTDKTGIYGLAYSIGALIVVFNQAIMNSFTPYTYQKLKNCEYDEIRKNASILVLAIAVISVSALSLAPEITYILGGEKYQEGVWVIAPVSASIFYRFLYGLYGNVEFYYEENKFIMYASVAIALLNVILNYIFINIYGYLAAGYTTLFCYAAYAFAHYFFSKKVLRKHTELARLYDDRLIFLIGIGVVVISTLMMSFFKYPIIRFALIFCVAVLFWLSRKKIIVFLRTIRGK